MEHPARDLESTEPVEGVDPERAPAPYGLHGERIVAVRSFRRSFVTQGSEGRPGSELVWLPTDPEGDNGSAATVIEPTDGVLGIGSGGAYATAAARALLQHTDQPPRQIVHNALTLAGELCVYTNTNVKVIEL